MSRLGGKLTALAVKCAAARGIYSDGNGLCLQVARGGSKSWIFRFRLAGRRRHAGLGGFPSVSLAEARERAAAARLMLQKGEDPVAARRGQRVTAMLSAAKAMTFSQCAERFIESHAAGWVPKNTAQWRSSLTRHALPILGPLPVQSIDTGVIMRVLEPLWTTKTVTAGRIRARVEAVLDWAKAHGHCPAGENPARWETHLENLLPPPSKISTVVGHPALAHVELPDFMAKLRQQPGVAARVMEFVVLTAARAGEARLADWAEIDMMSRTWSVPAAKMKMARTHRVPLSSAAVELLEALPGPRTGLIFLGTKPGQPIGSTQLSRVLERMDRGDVTTHGFRSSFATWAATCTTFSSEAVELALAHVTGSKVRRAYQRGDLLERRVALMEQWGQFCSGEEAPAAEVIQLRTT